MAPVRKLADVIIDTTKFNVHELRQFIIDRFQNPGQAAHAGFRGELRIPLRHPDRRGSGFRRALSAESAFYSAARARSAAKTRASRATSVRFRRRDEFLRRIESLLAYLIPHYIREGKSYLTVAIGCTGGRHRSVALAEVMRRSLQRKGYASKVVHRDLDKSLS